MRCNNAYCLIPLSLSEKCRAHGCRATFRQWQLCTKKKEFPSYPSFTRTQSSPILNSVFQPAVSHILTPQSPTHRREKLGKIITSPTLSHFCVRVNLACVAKRYYCIPPHKSDRTEGVFSDVIGTTIFSMLFHCHLHQRICIPPQIEIVIQNYQ